MAEIVLIDHEAMSDLKRIAEMLREDTSFKRQRLDDATPAPLRNSQLPNMQLPVSTLAYRGTGANSIRPAPFASAPNSYFSSSTSGRKRCPPLTQTEIGLLNKHKGCRKCRTFYVAHRGQNCPYDFPDSSTYVPLTEEMAYDAMRKTAVASTYAAPAPFHEGPPAIHVTPHHLPPLRNLLNPLLLFQMHITVTLHHLLSLTPLLLLP